MQLGSCIAAAPVQPLTWELVYAEGAALKSKKGGGGAKIKKTANTWQTFC